MTTSEITASLASALPTLESLEPGDKRRRRALLLMLLVVVLLATGSAGFTLRRPRKKPPALRLPVSRGSPRVFTVSAIVLLAGLFAVALLEGLYAEHLAGSGRAPLAPD